MGRPLSKMQTHIAIGFAPGAYRVWASFPNEKACNMFIDNELSSWDSAMTCCKEVKSTSTLMPPWVPIEAQTHVVTSYQNSRLDVYCCVATYETASSVVNELIEDDHKCLAVSQTRSWYATDPM